MYYINRLSVLKGFCNPGTTNCNYFLFWVPFLSPCLQSCFGGSMLFPVLRPHQKFQFLSWNVLLEVSGSLDLLISDLVGVAERLQGRAQGFRLCIFQRSQMKVRGRARSSLPKSPTLVVKQQNSNSLSLSVKFILSYKHFLVKSITFLILRSEHFL